MKFNHYRWGAKYYSWCVFAGEQKDDPIIYAEIDLKDWSLGAQIGWRSPYYPYLNVCLGPFRFTLG